MNTILLIICCVFLVVITITSLITVLTIIKYTKDKKTAISVLRIAGAIILALAVIGLAFGISYIEKDKQSSTTYQDHELSDFNELSVDEYLDLLKKDEKNIVLIARPTCGYCVKFTPVLAKVSKERNITVNYVNTDKLDEESWDKFTNSLTYLSEEEWGTPLLLVVQNGELVNYNSGYVEEDTLKTFFEDNGF